VSLPVLAGVAVLGGSGAVLRLLLDGWVSARTRSRLPLGTLAVNLSGACVLGILSGAALSGSALRLFGTGLIGAYTTFSTWMFESHRLAEDGGAAPAAVNLVLSLLAGVLLAWAGTRIGGGL